MCPITPALGRLKQKGLGSSQPGLTRRSCLKKGEVDGEEYRTEEGRERMGRKEGRGCGKGRKGRGWEG